jgi:UDP-glucose 4-epimerase
MTSLVTGGAGFIGSHVAEELSKMGEDVVVLDDLSGGIAENITGNRVIFVQGSITDVRLINQLFEKYRFDYVYHLAAYAAEGLSHFIKRFNYENNLIGSINLINAAVNYQVKTFVFTSSIAVYGDLKPPMREDMYPVPEDSYGIAKLSVEQELNISKKMFGLDSVIFRPHNVYGERQNIGDKYRNVIGIFMNQILQGKPMTIFGDGEQLRAFTYILDVAPIIARSVLVPQAFGQVINLGSDRNCSLNHLACAVAHSMGVEANIVHFPARNEVKFAFSSHEKAKRIFNLSETVPLEEGLDRMAAWVKTIGARSSKKFANIEIEKNIPSFWLENE